MHSPSFQDRELKLHRYVKYSQVQVVGRLTILPYPGGVKNEGLITQKTLIRRAFAKFSRYGVETSKVRQRLHEKSRGEVVDSTVSQQG